MIQLGPVRWLSLILGTHMVEGTDWFLHTVLSPWHISTCIRNKYNVKIKNDTIKSMNLLFSIKNWTWISEALGVPLLTHMSLSSLDSTLLYKQLSKLSGKTLLFFSLLYSHKNIWVSRALHAHKRLLLSVFSFSYSNGMRGYLLVSVFSIDDWWFWKSFPTLICHPCILFDQVHFMSLPIFHI